MKHFKTYFSSKNCPVDVDLLIQSAEGGDTAPLENALIEFFQEFHLQKNGNNVLPNKNTIDVCKSHLKTTILGQTNGRVDIGSTMIFK